MVEDEETGVSSVQCLCKTMNYHTVIEDLKGIFRGSKIDDVFSEGGFQAFTGADFHKIYIFYIMLLQVVMAIISIRVGIQKDIESAKSLPQVTALSRQRKLINLLFFVSIIILLINCVQMNQLNLDLTASDI